MEKYTKILIDEHQNILKMIKLLNQEADKFERQKEVNEDFWQSAASFIKNYADEFHHAKEEDLLFKEMCQDSVVLHCNPTDQMIFEHNQGRGFVRGLKEGLEELNRQKIINNARNYAELLQSHILKEDNILYPMAEEALSRAVKDSLAIKFNEVEEKFTKGKIDGYLSIIKKYNE